MTSRLFLAILISFLLVSPAYALGTWLATDNFDSYSNGASISGANGGSGWSGAWTLAAGTMTTNTAPVGGQGGIALKHASGATDGETKRSFTALSSGIMQASFYTSKTSGIANTQSFILLNGAANPIICRLGITTNGQIECYNNNTTTYVAQCSISVNTWTTIVIQFGQSANTFAVSCDGGSTYNAPLATNGSFSTISGVDFQGSASDTVDWWLDDIRASTPIAAASFVPANIYGWF